MLAVDLRYKGQAFEMTVPWRGGLDATGQAETLAAFHDEHERRYSYANRNDVVELVTARLVAIGRLPRVSETPQASEGDAVRAGERQVFTDGRWETIAVWRRASLGPDTVVHGPAIVEEDYTTVYLAAGWQLARTPDGSLIADRQDARS